MILTFGSVSEAFVVALPGLVALLAYAVAAVLSQRAETGVRASLVVAWLAHALAIAVDTSGVGTDISGARFGFAPALSVTLWLVIPCT